MDSEAIAGRYRLEERLGVGGMAEVWSAHDLELERQVAIKLLGRGADPARFEREARAAAALSHPNICQLYDFGEADGQPFMVLECLPEGTLEDRLASGEPLPDEETERVAREIAAGLAHAHEKGLVHRDLKPANILFDAEGRAKIADFGIARLGDAGTLTEAGTLLGTAAYLSPEQASGEPATPASDVYAFGVILYRMLSGRLPFESEDAIELVRKHRDEEPPRLATVRPDAPPVLESVATAALAKSPLDRPADGAALLDELGEEEEPTALLATGGDEGSARTEVLPFAERHPGAARPQRRRVLFAGLLLLGLSGAGVGAAFWATSGGSSSPVAPPTTAPLSTAEPRPPETTAPGSTVSTASTTEPTTSEPETTEPTTTATTAPPGTTETVPATTAPPTTEPGTTETLPTTEPTTTEPTTTTEPATTAGQPPETTTTTTTVP